MQTLYANQGLKALDRSDQAAADARQLLEEISSSRVK